MDDGTGVGIGIGMGSTLTPPFTYLLLVVIGDWWLVAEEVCNVCTYLALYLMDGCVQNVCVLIPISPYPCLHIPPCASVIPPANYGYGYDLKYFRTFLHVLRTFLVVQKNKIEFLGKGD